MREVLVNNIGGMRGFCVMHRKYGGGGWGEGADEREMLLDRNLVSVVRDAPYAVDHLSARSQRPIISRDTCACPPIKSVTCRAGSVRGKSFSIVTEGIRVSHGTVRST